MGFAKIAANAAVFTIGICTLNLYLLGVVLDGSLFKPVPKAKKAQRKAARKQIWDLKVEPIPGFQHKFFTTEDNLTLHYVQGGTVTPDSPLVIFLHGFPDSWFLWRHHLASLDLQKAHLIAVDLPGYGGSEPAARASANGILTALAQFVIGMKDKKSHDDCILVAHDWGAVVGYRLASEAGSLFTRILLFNAVHPALAIENATRSLVAAQKMLHTYIRSPTNFRLVRKAFSSLKPLLTQLKASHYVSIFLLPMSLAKLLLTIGDNWFLRILARISRSESEANSLGSSLGPSIEEVEDGYPPGVVITVKRNQHFNRMLEYYRDSLPFGRWQKPLEVVASENANGGNSLIEKKIGTLTCPVTLVYGGRDTAFHRPFCYEGLDQFLGAKSSFLVCFPTMGHWTTMSNPGLEASIALIQWSIDGHGAVTDVLEKVYPEAKVELSR